MTDKYLIAIIIVILLLVLLRSVYVDQYQLRGNIKAWEVRYKLMSQEYLKALEDADQQASMISTMRDESEKMRAKIIADDILKNREGFKP